MTHQELLGVDASGTRVDGWNGRALHHGDLPWARAGICDGEVFEDLDLSDDGRYLDERLAGVFVE